MHVATGVAFPQKSESTTFHQRRGYKPVLSFVLLLEILEALSVAARHLSRGERQV